jgi:hypothetical protein|tara:strand:- start:4042 stop:4533 length:492 start_codon:yes stop_codon:yes gene_type:complete
MAFSGNALCNSFKKELLEGVHNFKNSGGSTFKLALFTNSQAGNDNLGGSSSTMDATVTAYSSSASNEVSNTGDYSAGGGTLTRVDPALKSTSTATTQFANLEFGGGGNVVTLTARGALIYNDSASGDPAVCVLDFGADKSASSGTFTVIFPTNDASNALIRIA